MSRDLSGLTSHNLRPRPLYHPVVPVVLLWSDQIGREHWISWLDHHATTSDRFGTAENSLSDDVNWTDSSDSRLIKALADGVFVSKIVRDPFDRAVSSFYTLAHYPNSSDHDSVAYRRQLRSWLYDDPDVPYGFSFVDYLRWLSSVSTIQIDTCHAPQLTKLETWLPDLKLVRFERLDEDIHSLESTVGLDLADIVWSGDRIRPVGSPGDRWNRRGWASRIQPPVPLPSNWPLPHTEAFVTVETANLVSRIFGIDYEAYGYEPRLLPQRLNSGCSHSERYDTDVNPEADNDPHAFALAMVGSGRRVLELGCASGYVTQALRDRGNTVVGVELNPGDAATAIGYAERVHVLDLDFDRVSDHERSDFDVLLAGDVLEHLRDPLPTLVDAMSLVVPGGEAIISVPNLAHADVRLHLLEGRVEYSDGGLLDRTHLRWMTRSLLRQLLDNAGLVAVELNRVTRPLGSTRINVTEGIHSPATLEFIRADPDHDVFQFVVRARRRTELAVDNNDPLADNPITWPDHEDEVGTEVETLRQYAHDLRVALNAWERSRTARIIRSLSRLSRIGRR